MTETIEKPDFIAEEQLNEMLDYLDALRDSGTINMYGAAPCLRGEWPLTRGQSYQVLNYWMKTYGKRNETHDEQQ